MIPFAQPADHVFTGRSAGEEQQQHQTYLRRPHAFGVHNEGQEYQRCASRRRVQETDDAEHDESGHISLVGVV